MKAFWVLLRLSFKSLLLTTFRFSGRKSKGKAASGIGAFILLSVLMVYLSGTYSFMLAQAFAMLGGLDIMLMLITLMATVFPFIYIVYASQSLVFSTKDVDLVLSLPVSAFSVMLARVMALYLESLLMVEMMLVPAAAAYLIYGGAGGVVFAACVAVSGLFLALVPTLLALVFGTLVSLFVSRLRFKNLFNIIFSILMVIGIMVMSLSISLTASTNMVSPSPNLVNDLRDSLTRAAPPLVWVVGAYMGRLSSLLLLAGITLPPFLGVCWLFSRFYKRILTLLSSHRLRTDYQLRGVAASSSFVSLFRKEARRFFGTPALVLNAGVGILMALMASGASIFFQRDIAQFMGRIVGLAGPEVYRHIAPLILAFICFFACMIYVSAVSISLEGKTLWILKEAPLSAGKVFAAKAGFNFALGAFTVVVCTSLLAVAFGLPWAEAAMVILLGLLFSGLVSTLGLMINLWLPRMDAENETVVIKQSAAVIVAMLANMLIAAAFFVLYTFVTPGMGFLAFGAVCAGILTVLNAGMILLLHTAGRKIFAAL